MLPTYSGKLRNLNPKMPDYQALPLSRIEYEKKNVPQVQGNGHGHATHAAPAPGAEKATTATKGAH